MTVDFETCLDTVNHAKSHLAQDAPTFLIFINMCAAPSGDLRFVVEPITGNQQRVTVQCKQVGGGAVRQDRVTTGA